MENKYRNREINMTPKEPRLLKNATESFLANLPILVCGMIVAFTIISEML